MKQKLQTDILRLGFAIVYLAAVIPLSAQNIITLSTAKQVGDTISLRVEVEGDIAFDGATILNETTKTFDFDEKKEYTLTAQTVTIRGKVTKFACRSNQLTSLDVSKNTALYWMDCTSNRLESLDVSKNIALKRLDCDNNSLTGLDVTKNRALTLLGCMRTNLTSLDLSKNTDLRKLDCSKITSPL